MGDQGPPLWRVWAVYGIVIFAILVVIGYGFYRGVVYFVQG
jgi:hypothetical protein